MINFSNINHFYFLGIGGIGMSALARYFNSLQKVVAGYDKTPSAITESMIDEGIHIHYEDNTKLLPEFLSGNKSSDDVVIIYTPAVPKDNKELNFLKSAGYKLWKRSEILGFIAADKTTIAVAGTHGKTTTSTMIAHILKYNKINCTAFLGGISANYNTNLLLPGEHDTTDVLVVEADEYDRSFLTLFPDYAVITSVDADHLDIYGSHSEMVSSYIEFANQVKESGTLVIKSGSPVKSDHVKSITYSIDQKSDVVATNVRVEDNAYKFSVYNDNKVFGDFILTWPGRHNVENATAAISICSEYGLSYESIKNALAEFKGVKRRFEYILKNENVVFIDDYAHHPSELNATISSVKEMYPGKTILGIFQPHLYSRTRDFVDGFGASLSELDEVILLDIYPARELPIPGITSKIILDKVKIKKKAIVKKENLSKAVLDSNADVVLTLGAGDIDQLVSVVKSSLEMKFNSEASK